MSLLQAQANNATFNFGLQIYQFCMGLDLGLGVRTSQELRCSLEFAKGSIPHTHTPGNSSHKGCTKKSGIRHLLVEARISGFGGAVCGSPIRHHKSLLLNELLLVIDMRAHTHTHTYREAHPSLQVNS